MKEVHLYSTYTATQNKIDPRIWDIHTSDEDYNNVQYDTITNGLYIYSKEWVKENQTDLQELHRLCDNLLAGIYGKKHGTPMGEKEREEKVITVVNRQMSLFGHKKSNRLENEIKDTEF